VPPGERADFVRHLKELRYPYQDESGNSAYRLFLGS
jgi:hypothetical protein